MDLFYRLVRTGAVMKYEPAAVVYHELVTHRGRLDRRIPYGHGMGAFCTLRMLDGDRFAGRVLTVWAVSRVREMLAALRAGRLRVARGGQLVAVGRGARREARSDRSSPPAPFLTVWVTTAAEAPCQYQRPGRDACREVR
jgi:hypothetical protein